MTEANSEKPEAATTETKAPVAKPRSRKPIRIVVILLVLAGAAFGIWKIFFSKPALPANVIALSGRIEGDDSAIAPKVTGRILEIRFREGDSVKAGETIALLDDPQMRAREDQAQDAVRNAENQVRAAQAQIPVLEQQLTQTELEVGQARLDAEGRVHQAEQQLAGAEAQLAQQEATLKINAFDREAYTRLARDGAVPERQGRGG
jgi:HlyD family secretion protein